MAQTIKTIDTTEVILQLYTDSDVPPPSIDSCVTSLRELLYACDGLTCIELERLNSRAAITFLLKHGGLWDIPESLELNKEPLAGYLYATPNFGGIFVEQSDIVVRRRFTIAHELGHYLLHRPLLSKNLDDGEQFLVEAFNSELTMQDDGDAESLPSGYLTFNRTADPKQVLPTYEQMEREANQFAVDLLMPESLVRSLIGRYFPHFQAEDLIWRLATDMLVSRSAMRIRLTALGLLPPVDVHFN